MISHHIEINNIKVLFLKSVYSIGFGFFFLSFLSAEDRKLDMLIFGEYFSRKEMEPLKSDGEINKTRNVENSISFHVQL